MSRLNIQYHEICLSRRKSLHFAMIYTNHPDVEEGTAIFTKNSKTLKGAEARVKRIVEGLGL